MVYCLKTWRFKVWGKCAAIRSYCARIVVSVWLLLLTATCPVGAQESYNVKIFTAYDGLPSTNILNVFQDSRDFLWILTDAGLSRFDGREFKNYASADGLLSSNLVSICEDGEGNLWVASGRGEIFKYGGRRFKKLSAQFKDINALAYKDGSIWVGTSNGLFSIADGRVYSYDQYTGLSCRNITCFLERADGTLLIGTERAVFQYKSESFELVWAPADQNYRIFSIAEDSEKKLWVSDSAGHIYTNSHGDFKAILERTDMRHEHDRASDDYVSRLLTNNMGEVVLFKNRRLKTYKSGALVKTTYTGDSMSVAAFNFIQGREGNYWFATASGLFMLKPSQVKVHEMPGGPVCGLFHLHGDPKTYISNGEEIFYMWNDSLRQLNPGAGPGMKQLFLFDKTPEGAFLYASAQQGVKIYKDRKYQWLYHPAKAAELSCAFNDGKKIYIGGKNIILIYEKGGLAELDPGCNCSIYSILHDTTDNRIYLGTDKGAFSLDGKRNLTHIPLPFNDSTVTVSDIRKTPNGSFLLSTQGYGLLYAEIKHDRFRLLKQCYSVNNLGGDYVNGSASDGNTVWIAAKNGVYKISEFTSATPILEYLNAEEGMPRYSWARSFILLSDSEVYVGGPGGLVRFSKHADFKSQIVQKTYINTIEVNGNPYQWKMNDSSLTFSGWPLKYKFKPDENSIRFVFGGVNLIRPSRIYYEYMLKGFQDNTVVTRSRSANFINLPPGNYEFKVRSTSNRSFANEKYTSFYFEIEAPMWKTWWFRLLIVAAIAVLINFAFMLRVRHYQKRQAREMEVSRQLNENKILAFQARMNPHFIFNSLNSIQYFITNNDKLSTLTYLSKFSRLLRLILDNSFESKILLEKEVFMLRSYVEMEEMRFDQAFSYVLNVADDDILGMRIPGMIVQPFVENAIIHGLLNKTEKGVLRISFRKEGKQIICTVDDNGVGRKKAAELNNSRVAIHHSHGISIAINRLELLDDPENGVINRVIFVDKNEFEGETGTTVIIYLPIL